jgi:CBS domain containing-hemolysin-like protein
MMMPPADAIGEGRRSPRSRRFVRAAIGWLSRWAGSPNGEGVFPHATTSELRILHAKRARDVMRPRTEVVAISSDATEDEVWSIVRTERYSRYPVIKNDSLDEIEGIFLAKDLWLHDDSKPFVLANYIRPATYVPDNRPAERVLDDLRRNRAHLGIVLDEYGGTAGIVALEDLIEEVIGDINDEYDAATTRDAVEANGVLEVAGSMSVVDAREEYRLPIPEGDWSTVGGFVFSELGRLAKMGDRVPYPGGQLEVVAMEGRRVAAVRALQAMPAEASASTEARL